MGARTLVLLTGSYPWDIGLEQTFIEPELGVIGDEFEQILLVPQMLGGQRSPLPDGVEVEESYAREASELKAAEILWRAARTTVVVEDLVQRPDILKSAAATKELLSFAGRAHHASDWARRFFLKTRIDPKRCVVCSFWWTAMTLGFAMAKRSFPGLVVATRTHGYDLYEDRHVRDYLPGRTPSLRQLDGVFPDSDKGTTYLRQRYGAAAAHCDTARLGVSDPGVQCRSSTDGVLRVVTCSRLVPLKRLGLLLSGVALAANQRPHMRVQWTHFGTGPLHQELEKRAGLELPGNATSYFAGYSTQQDLFGWYQRNPVDVFANVSESEGTPVSIMEAIACGIPTLATAVGGNPEIATRGNGVVLEENPTPSEIAAALYRFVDEPTAAAAWRAASRRLWSERYDAVHNYRAFARRLKALPMSRD